MFAICDSLRCMITADCLPVVLVGDEVKVTGLGLVVRVFPKPIDCTINFEKKNVSLSKNIPTLPCVLTFIFDQCIFVDAAKVSLNPNVLHFLKWRLAS